MAKKYHLHCFRCGNELEKDKVWRWNSNPYCEDCMEELLYDEYDDEFTYWILDTLNEEPYNRNYDKLYNDFIFIKCPNCQTENIVLKTWKNGTGKSYSEEGSEISCGECNAYLIFDKDGKIIEFAKNYENWLSNSEKIGVEQAK